MLTIFNTRWRRLDYLDKMVKCLGKIEQYSDITKILKKETNDNWNRWKLENALNKWLVETNYNESNNWNTKA